MFSGGLSDKLFILEHFDSYFSREDFDLIIGEMFFMGVCVGGGGGIFW